MQRRLCVLMAGLLWCGSITLATLTAEPQSSPAPSLVRDFPEGQRLFEHETFGGNGRTCLTCHSRETGTVSPQDARARFRTDPRDPLFLHDGSDDDDGDGFGDGWAPRECLPMRRSLCASRCIRTSN